MKNLFENNKFFRNIATVITGTAASQLILIIATPLLTRLYDPAAFGVFSLFIAITTIVSSFAAFKFDLAVVLPKDNKSAINLFYLSSFFIIINVIILSLIILIFNNQLISFLQIDELKGYLWLIPVFVLSMGFFGLFNNWNTRRQQFKRLSLSRITRSTSQVSIQLIISNFMKSGGLIIGHTVGQLIASSTLLRYIYKNDRKLFTIPDFNLMKKQIKQYKEFPLYNAPQHLLSATASNSAPFILAISFGPEIVGLYAVSVKILTMPITLISESVGKVFYQKATEMYNEKKSVLRLLTRTTSALGLVFIVPWIIFILIAPELFGFVLGEEWYDAGQYARWVALWMFFVALNAPAVKVFIIYRLQKIQLYLNILSFILRISTLIIGGIYFSPLVTIQLFVLASIVSSVTFILLAFYFVNRFEKKKDYKY